MLQLARIILLPVPVGQRPEGRLAEPARPEWPLNLTLLSVISREHREPQVARRAGRALPTPQSRSPPIHARDRPSQPLVKIMGQKDETGINDGLYKIHFSVQQDVHMDERIYWKINSYYFIFLLPDMVDFLKNPCIGAIIEVTLKNQFLKFKIFSTY